LQCNIVLFYLFVCYGAYSNINTTQPPPPPYVILQRCFYTTVLYWHNSIDVIAQCETIPELYHIMKPVWSMLHYEIYTVYTALWNRYKPVSHYEIAGVYCDDAPFQGNFTIPTKLVNTNNPVSDY
jgi:hypothetical protein